MVDTTNARDPALGQSRQADLAGYPASTAAPGSGRAPLPSCPQAITEEVAREKAAVAMNTTKAMEAAPGRTGAVVDAGYPARSA